MKYLVMFTLLALGSMLQSALPGITMFGGARVPVLMSISLYYTLSRESRDMLICAFAAGFLHDALSMIPLGYTSLGLVAAGMIIQKYRELIFGQQWFTQIFLGASVGALLTVLLYILLMSTGVLFIGFWAMLQKAISAAIIGAITLPLACLFLEWFERQLGVLDPVEEF